MGNPACLPLARGIKFKHLNLSRVPFLPPAPPALPPFAPAGPSVSMPPSLSGESPSLQGLTWMTLSLEAFPVVRLLHSVYIEVLVLITTLCLFTAWV